MQTMNMQATMRADEQRSIHKRGTTYGSYRPLRIRTEVAEISIAVREVRHRTEYANCQ